MPGQTFQDSQIDRSIGTILFLMLVCGAFLIAVVGMMTVRQSVEKLADDPTKVAVDQPVYDLGPDPNN